jgi:hypothetical protein
VNWHGIIQMLDAFLWPVLQAAARGEPWPRQWSVGGAWDALQPPSA